MRAAIVFPGQGSQAPAMGAPWRNQPGWEIVERAEKVLDIPLAPALTDPDRPPSSTATVQLCVLLTSLMAWDAVKSTVPVPLAFAGHSLGQITALTAAGVLTLEDAVRIVALRGEVTAEECRRQAGGMSAMLALPRDRAVWACSVSPGETWLANDNAPGQVVLAGTKQGLARVENMARRLGARKIVRLAVEGAFHTPLMLAGARRFLELLHPFRFAPPTSPLISNSNGAVAPDTGWDRRLAEHLIRPVYWRASQLRLRDLGVNTLIEVGFGSTLTSIAKRTIPSVDTRNVDSPDAAELLAREMNLTGPHRPILSGV